MLALLFKEHDRHYQWTIILMLTCQIAPDLVRFLRLYGTLVFGLVFLGIKLALHSLDGLDVLFVLAYLAFNTARVLYVEKLEKVAVALASKLASLQPQ